jgi:hypothetical protein
MFKCLVLIEPGLLKTLTDGVITEKRPLFFVDILKALLEYSSSRLSFLSSC